MYERKNAPSGSGPQNSDTDASAGTPSGDRIAKVLSRAGIASRREAGA